MYILKVYSTEQTGLKHKCWEKSLRTKQTVQKMLSFFFRELQLIMVLLLICGSYMSWSTRLISLKLCVGFSIFDSVSFLLKFIFLFNKMHGLFDFKNVVISFKIKIIEKPHSFAPRPRIFKFHQEVWKLSDIFKSRKKKFWERFNSNFKVNIWHSFT